MGGEDCSPFTVLVRRARDGMTQDEKMSEVYLLHEANPLGSLVAYVCCPSLLPVNVIKRPGVTRLSHPWII